MRRGVVMTDWKRGLLTYVEASVETLAEFEKILNLCGGRLERRNLPCITSLVSRLRVNSVMYVTDLYGIANQLAFKSKTPRSYFLQKAWSYLESIICTKGPVECGRDVDLTCCEPCGTACLLAEALGVAKLGVEVDLRGEVLNRLRGEG